MSAVTINCSGCNKSNRINSANITQQQRCQHCNKGMLDGVVIELLPHNYQALSGAKLPLIVFMSGPNCSICKSFSKIFASVAKQSEGKYRFGEAYLPKNSALANKFRLRGVPAIAVIKAGKVRGLVNGGMRQKELLDFIGESLN
ncbi:MAG: hypothetical protein HRU25_08225 [Psychrobium sp.]|nr:hypothetical protein [Psychrobium sp.]